MVGLKKVLDVLKCLVDPEYAYKTKEKWTKQIIRIGRKRT